MTRLKELFELEDRMAFLIAITAGDPDLNTTFELLAAVQRAGVDGVVLEVPYSDPLAADKLGRRSLRRALEGGTNLETVLASAPELVSRSIVPMVLSSYAGPVVAYGVDRFAQAVTEASLAGTLLVDVPVEEAQWFVPLASAPVAWIHTVSPTADRDRLRAVSRTGSGFVCVVADPHSPELPLRALRKSVRLPVVVASELAEPESVSRMRGQADGVVALAPVAEAVERIGTGGALIEEVERRVGALVEACRR